MDRKMISYQRECEKAKKSGLKLITEYESYRTAEPIKYQCTKCGIIFEKKLSGSALKCKNCSSAHSVAFEKAKYYLANLGYSLKTSIEKFNANANAFVEVKCKNCGKEITCHYRSIGKCECYDLDNKFNEIVSKSKLYDIELCFNRKDYIGNYLGKNSVFYPVKCLKCNEMYEASFSNERPNMCPRCARKEYRSSVERKVGEFLDRKGIKYYPNYKGLHLRFSGSLRDLELDIYLPDYRIAFEFNGFYYHNSGPFGKPKFYHSEKTDLCLSNSVKLFHLWEDIDDDMIFSIIESKLGLSKKIFARKTKVKELTDGKFFSENHVDGDCRSIRRWGLFYMNECYAAISLRLTKDGKPEIARFCNKRHFTVVGGYSKLLKILIGYLKENGNYKELISYCNRDLSPDKNNNFYSKSGFTFVGECSLIMRYWATKRIDELGVISSKIYNRQKFQKFKVEGLVKDSKGLSELEINEKLGIYPIYNSGNFKYSLLL